MLDLEDICKTIGRLEQGRTSPQACELLASLYIIRDHFGAWGRQMEAVPGTHLTSHEGFTAEMAEQWLRRMDNEDGTHGAHWTLDQAKQVMAQRGIECDPVQFWTTLNMMYSDYSKAAQKHGVGNSVEFYADMACAFLKDKDAPKDKLARYYRHIVNA